MARTVHLKIYRYDPDKDSKPYMQDVTVELKDTDKMLLDALQRIKSDADLCHIPVVVFTTSAAEEDVLKSYKLHANAYVTKPVDVDQFMSAVRQIDEFFVQVVRLPQF